MLLLGGNAGFVPAQFVEVPTEELGSNLVQLDIELLAPSQESFYGAQVCRTGVRVAELAEEELLGGKDRRLPGAADDVRQALAPSGRRVSGVGNQVFRRLGRVAHRGVHLMRNNFL